MTPFQLADAVLQDLVEFAATEGVTLPAEAWRYPMVGNNVIACEGVTVNVVNVDMTPMNNLTSFAGSQLQVTDCGPAQVAQLTVAIARNCAIVHTNDGIDDPVAVARVSNQLDVDGQLLWDFAVGFDAWFTKSWSVNYVIEGALSTAVLSLTTGVP